MQTVSVCSSSASPANTYPTYLTAAHRGTDTEAPRAKNSEHSLPLFPHCSKEESAAVPCNALQLASRLMRKKRNSTYGGSTAVGISSVCVLTLQNNNHKVLCEMDAHSLSRHFKPCPAKRSCIRPTDLSNSLCPGLQPRRCELSNQNSTHTHAHARTHQTEMTLHH